MRFLHNILALGFLLKIIVMRGHFVDYFLYKYLKLNEVVIFCLFRKVITILLILKKIQHSKTTIII